MHIVDRYGRTGFIPRLEEQLLELFHDRALDAHVGVAPTIFDTALWTRTAARRTRIRVIDVDAAGESDLSIHDHDLAVVAILYLPHGGILDRIYWMVFAHLDSLAAQIIEEAQRSFSTP